MSINFICYAKREKILCRMTSQLIATSLSNAVITPHIAWTTKEALQRLLDITTRNLSHKRDCCTGWYNSPFCYACVLSRWWSWCAPRPARRC